jgi:dTMP kinase
MNIEKGILIAVEGIDGSGKSTLAKNLAQALEPLPVLLTKEPGATALGCQLRDLLQTKDYAMCPKAEFLLFAADRANHFEYVILPSLEKKMIVISDRLSDSSVIYQGYARGLDIDIIKMVNQWAMNHRKPDLTIYVRLEPSQAKKRLINRKIPLATLEKQGNEFSKKTFEGFEALYAGRSDVLMLDATLDTTELTKQAKEAIMSWIKLNNQ